MSILQELLNLGLVEIGSDDSRFEKMQAAASALAKRLKDEPRLLIPATLVALDEDVDEDDPFFLLVEEMVTVEWKTLRNTHSNRPRQLLRSITIDALATASAESAEVSGVVWNTAASLVRHEQVRPGKAANLIEKFLDQAFEKAECEAAQRAGMSTPVKMRRKKKSSNSPAEMKFETKIEDDEILQFVTRSAGPQNDQGVAPPDPNQHWPNAGQPWSFQFAPRMTAALVKAVNLGTSRLAKTMAKDLGTHMTSLEKRLLDELETVEQMQTEREQCAASGRMRLDVLWWSEARYSPLLKKGYRDLAPPLTALLAAVDLAAIVPPLAPASVSYVLAETVADICRGTEFSQSSLPLENYLKELAVASLELREALPRATTNEGRLPLVELVGEAAAGFSVSEEIIRARAGIEADLQLAPSDFAMWMFREIQARRMVEELP